MKSVLLAFMLTSGVALAQTAPCGLTSVADGRELIYPPIAKAAHVTGQVILLVSFQLDGNVWKALVVSGPQMLRPAALEYVETWKANEYGGPRTCPIIISFQFIADRPAGVERQDIQHVAIYAQPVCLCDPPAEIHVKRRWYWPF
jgi:hypothetical protein